MYIHEIFTTEFKCRRRKRTPSYTFIVQFRHLSSIASSNKWPALGGIGLPHLYAVLAGRDTWYVRGCFFIVTAMLRHIQSLQKSSRQGQVHGFDNSVVWHHVISQSLWHIYVVPVVLHQRDLFDRLWRRTLPQGRCRGSKSRRRYQRQSGPLGV